MLSNGRRWALIGLLAPLLSAPVRAGEEEREALRLALDGAVQRASGGGLWGTVLVARGGEVLLEQGYGCADYLRRPNGPETLFELASVSKQLTAAAALALRQDGKLRLETTLGELFPDAPADKRAITIEQLVTHTAGISPDLGVPYGWPGERAEYVRQMLAAPLASQPGQRFAYSNVGYALLAAAIEVASGRAFEDYVHERLFAPAGMRSSGFVNEARLRDDPRSSSRLDERGRVSGTATRWMYGWGYRGMGGAVSTARDLLRWDRALRGEAVLDAASQAELYRPRLDGYACGWMVERTRRGTRLAHHSGGVEGYGAWVARWLEEDALVVILSNGRSDLRAVGDALERVLFPPPRLRLSIDAQPYELNRWGALQLGERAGWEVAAAGEADLALRLVDPQREHAVASLELPRSAGEALATRLEEALAAQVGGRDDDSIDAGLYLGNYQLDQGRLAREGPGLTVEVAPEYRGQDQQGRAVVDKRVLLVIADEEEGAWPVMVLQGRARARRLIEALRAAR